ncbi:MAG: hypothetical protein ACR2GU_09950 [Rubrobacteraceae bacterium]
MGVLKTLWGLLVDDARLAFILVFTLIAAFLFSRMNWSLVAAVAIWVGLLAALWSSTEHQLKLRRTRVRRTRNPNS